MDREPKSGELYRHFKNGIYQVVTVAVHTETAEKLVIYQALYGDFQVYARPLAMFMSEVDRKKYPQARQRYRFERIEREEMAEGVGTVTAGAACAATTDGGHQTVDEKLMAFLDTDDWEEKYNIVVSMRDEITDHLVNNMAVAIDVVVPEGNLSDRYESLKSCIRTKQRYERERLR